MEPPRIHVLIADDNKINRLLLTKLIRRDAPYWTIAEVQNGKEALDYLAADPAVCPRPDMIFMDSAMPIMSGVECARIIRTRLPFVADPKIRSAPIICLWAGSKKPRWEVMDDWLDRPFKWSAVREIQRRYSRCQIVENDFGGIAGGPPHFMKVPVWGGWGTRKYLGPRSLL